jgi:hypothetical protein
MDATRTFRPTSSNLLRPPSGAYDSDEYEETSEEEEEEEISAEEIEESSHDEDRERESVAPDLPGIKSGHEGQILQQGGGWTIRVVPPRHVEESGSDGGPLNRSDETSVSSTHRDGRKRDSKSHQRFSALPALDASMVVPSQSMVSVAYDNDDETGDQHQPPDHKSSRTAEPLYDQTSDPHQPSRDASPRAVRSIVLDVEAERGSTDQCTPTAENFAGKQAEYPDTSQAAQVIAAQQAQQPRVQAVPPRHADEKVARVSFATPTPLAKAVAAQSAPDSGMAKVKASARLDAILSRS